MIGTALEVVKTTTADSDVGLLAGIGQRFLRAYTKINYGIAIYATSANSTGSHNRLSIKRIDATYTIASLDEGRFS